MELKLVAALGVMGMAIVGSSLSPAAGGQSRQKVQPGLPLMPVYAKNCAVCHGSQLKGASGPSLLGPEMADRSSDELAQAIKNTMPVGRPRSLPDADYRALAQYILSANGVKKR